MASTEDTPQHRRRLPSDQPVEDAPSLLRLDKLHVEFARLFECFADRVGRDLMEDHPAHRHARVQDLEHVPADCFAFTVLVGGEEELVGILQRLLQLADNFLLVRMHDVDHVEVIVGIDSGQPAVRLDLVGLHRLELALVARQVANMTDAGLHGEVASEIARDRARLGRRLDDDERLRHDGVRSIPV